MYASSLVGRPRILVGTKSDLPAAADGLAALEAAFPGERILPLSSFSREGLAELKMAILQLVTAQKGSASEMPRSAAG
jgi:GTPase